MKTKIVFIFPEKKKTFKKMAWSNICHCNSNLLVVMGFVVFYISDNIDPCVRACVRACVCACVRAYVLGPTNISYRPCNERPIIAT